MTDRLIMKISTRRVYEIARWINANCVNSTYSHNLPPFTHNQTDKFEITVDLGEEDATLFLIKYAGAFYQPYPDAKWSDDTPYNRRISKLLYGEDNSDLEDIE